MPAPPGAWTTRDLDLLEELMRRESRGSLAVFRRYMHPELVWNWFADALTNDLQAFWRDYKAGLRPRVAISTPPQHGKSIAVIDLLAWAAGHDPDDRVIFASFSERLGVRANMALQRIYDSPRYQQVFPGTRIAPFGGGASDAGIATRNRDLIEYVGRRGYFRNTTARGAVTGESASLIVGDDLLKGRAEASSQTTRDALWSWVTDDLLTRLSDDGAVLLVGTRWVPDDPIGRIAADPVAGVRVINYKALAVEDEPHRRAGEPLFPAIKSAEFLSAQRSIMGAAAFAALYQGDPQIEGGNLIKGAWFPRYSQLPATLDYRVVVVDTALKSGVANDYTVAQVWGAAGGRIYLLDQMRGKIEAADIRVALLAFLAKHRAVGPEDPRGQIRRVEVEDKASGIQLVQELRRMGGVPVKAIPRSRDKYARFCDVAGYMEAGSVLLPADAGYTFDLVAELEEFTADDSHVHDDQVDALIGACESMLLGATSVVSLWEKML